MRKALMVVAVAVAALALSVPVLALPNSMPWWKPAKHFVCAGTIAAVDTSAKTVTVRLQRASGGAPYLSDTLVANVDPKATILTAESGTLTPIALRDLVVGNGLRVVGVVDRSTDPPVFVGKRLLMRQATLPSDVKRFAFRGHVTAVDASANKLTARLTEVTWRLSPAVRREVTFNVAGDAHIWLFRGGWPVKTTLADVDVGARVLARGVAAAADPSLTIHWLLVRHAPARSAR